MGAKTPARFHHGFHLILPAEMFLFLLERSLFQSLSPYPGHISGFEKGKQYR